MELLSSFMIFQAMDGRTSILISNKAFKLRDHGRIIVLEEGKVEFLCPVNCVHKSNLIILSLFHTSPLPSQIVEEGSYAELVANKKVFAQHLKKDLQDMKELGLSPLG